ncbi:tetratricopeptide repeat protein [soil metagenome]
MKKILNSHLMISAFCFMLCTTLFFAATEKAHAQKINAAQQFSEGNKAYRAGRYDDAAKLFEAIISANQLSPSVYYNLGNCYYKTQDFPRAVLNYERARRMAPLDDDIQYNLKLAYSNTIDKIEPVPQLFYERWWEMLLSGQSPSDWAWTGIIILWVSIGLGIGYLFANTISKRKFTFLSGTALLILAVFFIFIASCSNNRLNHHKSAVVMEASSYVKSSPDQKSTNLFMLHAGTKIDVIEELSGWKKIRIANGNVGWIDEKSIQQI